MGKEKQHKQAETCEAEEMQETDNSTANSGGEPEIDQEKELQRELKKELDSIKGELEEKTKQCADYLDKLQRTAAEFDNYKKRSTKEKEAIYADAVSDAVAPFIPVLDNIERALLAIPSDGSAKTIKDGIEMVFKQFKEAFKNIGIEEIKAVNETFDPMLHNAVMHIEDEAYGHNIVVEEFQKGYTCKDKVIRYSMVKVAN